MNLNEVFDDRITFKRNNHRGILKKIPFLFVFPPNISFKHFPGKFRCKIPIGARNLYLKKSEQKVTLKCNAYSKQNKRIELWRSCCLLQIPQVILCVKIVQVVVKLRRKQTFGFACKFVLTRDSKMKFNYDDSKDERCKKEKQISLRFHPETVWVR